jgi:hypothetical protein
MFEQIGIEKKIEKEEVKAILKDVFRNFDIHYFDRTDQVEIENEIKDNSILFSIFNTESEFPIKIELTGTPESNSSEREQFLEKLLSDRLQCRTITSYQGPETPTDYPYASVIFNDGHCYLADDYNTIWADGQGGHVKIVREIQFKPMKFDFSAEPIVDSR